MRVVIGFIAALVLVGCAAVSQTSEAPQVEERMALANGFSGRAEAAGAICSERGQQPGTEAHAACVKSLLKAEGRKTRSLASSLAERAARMKYTCVDQITSRRLVRCYDI
jgi:hypothetical protein